MKQQTAEVEVSQENAARILKLIDRANKLGDEVKLLQSILKGSKLSDREEQLLHDELDVVRDYREVTLERIALLSLGDLSKGAVEHTGQQPALGCLDGDEAKEAA